MPRVLLFSIAAAAIVACEPAAPAPAASPVVSKPPVSAPPPQTPDVAFPSTPAGAAATAWLNALNEGSYDGLLAFYRAHFAPALNANHEDEGRSYDMAGAHVSDGHLHLRAIEKATDTSIIAILVTERTERWSRNVIELDPRPPHLIVNAHSEGIDQPWIVRSRAIRSCRGRYETISFRTS